MYHFSSLRRHCTTYTHPLISVSCCRRITTGTGSETPASRTSTETPARTSSTRVHRTPRSSTQTSGRSSPSPWGRTRGTSRSRSGSSGTRDRRYYRRLGTSLIPPSSLKKGPSLPPPCFWKSFKTENFS